MHKEIPFEEMRPKLLFLVTPGLKDLVLNAFNQN